MKVKVTKRFKDKYTGKLHKKGDVIEVSKKRFAEIQKVGDLVQEVTSEDKTTEATGEEKVSESE